MGTKKKNPKRGASAVEEMHTGNQVEDWMKKQLLKREVGAVGKYVGSGLTKNNGVQKHRLGGDEGQISCFQPLVYPSAGSLQKTKLGEEKKKKNNGEKREASAAAKVQSSLSRTSR